MQIIDGKKLAAEIREEIAREVEELKASRDITPGLAVVLVGDDPASHAYVKMKAKACKEAGIYSITHEMPESISQSEIEETILMMNKNPKKILELIDPAKDVDGFHPYNFGRLMTGLDSFVPCTPLGVMEMLEAYGIDPKGKDACVVGASNIVGKPMAALLLNAFATVDICHIYTKDLASHTRKADILVVGVGKAGLITEEMVKEGAVVIDIGINRLEDGSLVGDVDYEAVAPKCSYITPVPGGVGPMTIAMLLKNTVKAAKERA